MINVIFNNRAIAFKPRQITEIISVPVDPFQLFGTPYGLFIPITFSGYNFIRWLNNPTIVPLDELDVESKFVFISNQGEVCLVDCSLEHDIITCVPYQAKECSIAITNREESFAWSYLLQKQPSMAEAISYFNENEALGIHYPTILTVNDWLDYAKEKEYNLTFYYSSFKVLLKHRQSLKEKSSKK